MRLGAVLAGGQSRRFGSDKSQALLQGRKLIDHAIESLSRYVGSVIVVGKEVQGIPCIPDCPQPHMGPLGGLNAALFHANERGFSGVLALGCDMPSLPDDAVSRLAGDGPVILHGQHLVGFWPSALSTRLDEYLAGTDDRSIRGWLQHAHPRIAYLDGPELPNINTPSDLGAVSKNWGLKMGAGRKPGRWSDDMPKLQS